MNPETYIIITIIGIVNFYLIYIISDVRTRLGLLEQNRFKAMKELNKELQEIKLDILTLQTAYDINQAKDFE